MNPSRDDGAPAKTPHFISKQFWGALGRLGVPAPRAPIEETKPDKSETKRTKCEGAKIPLCVFLQRQKVYVHKAAVAAVLCMKRAPENSYENASDGHCVTCPGLALRARCRAEDPRPCLGSRRGHSRGGTAAGRKRLKKRSSVRLVGARDFERGLPFGRQATATNPTTTTTTRTTTTTTQ